MGQQLNIDREMANITSSSEPYVLELLTKHTHTMICLHGRGGDGWLFTGMLLSTILPAYENRDTLRSRFPSRRWVFPSAPCRWNSSFE